MDRISNLPSGIIENILCFLPIQEAARTSILSREWRYQWIKIPKLTIIEDMFHVSTDAAELSILGQRFYTRRERIMMFKRRKIFYAINQVLSKHEGPIHEFTLFMQMDNDYYDEIDHILSHLAQRNTVKKLQLHFHWVGYSPPLSLFLFRQLTDLCLAGCYVKPPSTFNGFNSLTSLSLQDIYVYDEPLRRLLSNCPLLKNVTLGDGYYVLKSGNEYPSIINLFECLPVVETLSISHEIIQSFKSSVHDGVPRELPTALIHLKYLTLNGLSFKHKDGLSILVLLIKSSPNLEKLEIDNRNLGVNYVSMEGDIWSFTLEDYADISLEHLNELHIKGFKNKGNELNFVKLILAKSPVLKKVAIYHQLTLNEWMQVSKVLLSFPRASPVVVINV